MRAKNCSICGEQKEESRENYKRSSDDIFHSSCRICEDKAKISKHQDGNGNILCVKCNKFLPPDMFGKSCRAGKNNSYRLNRDNRCRDCRTTQTARSRKSKSGDGRINRILKERFLAARDRSNRNGNEFTITEEFVKNLLVVQDYKCAISGIPLTFELGSGRVYTNVSLDRKDAQKGYTEENVQLVCMAVNQMKSDMTIEQLVDFCKSIIKYN